MIDLAKRLAVKAGKEVLFLQGRVDVQTKKRKGDIVTKADTTSEKIILDGLRKEFPGHSFISEEAGKDERNSEYIWFVDPLDGTIPYAAGMPTFGISIGLIKNGKPILGVINLPALDSLYWAELGSGAFLNGKKIHVNDKSDLLTCVIGFDVGYAGGRAQEFREMVEPIADQIRYPTMLGSTVVGLSYVATGIYDAYLHSAHPWDFAAGAVIVEVTGGKVTDFQGNPIDWSRNWIDMFASNGIIHDQILGLLNP